MKRYRTPDPDKVKWSVAFVYDLLSATAPAPGTTADNTWYCMVICYFVLHRIRLSRLTGYDVPGWQEWYADTAGNSRSSTPFPGVWNMRLSSGRQNEKTADHHAWSGIVCSARVCLKHVFREMYPEGHDRYTLKHIEFRKPCDSCPEGGLCFTNKTSCKTRTAPCIRGRPPCLFNFHTLLSAVLRINFLSVYGFISPYPEVVFLSTL